MILAEWMEIVDYIFDKGYALFFMGLLAIEIYHLFVREPKEEARRQQRLDDYLFGEYEKDKMSEE